MNDHFNSGFRLTGDIISVSVLIGTLADMLPDIAALLTVVWMLICIWETRTVGRLLGRKTESLADDKQD